MARRYETSRTRPLDGACREPEGLFTDTPEHVRVGTLETQSHGRQIPNVSAALEGDGRRLRVQDFTARVDDHEDIERSVVDEPIEVALFPTEIGMRDVIHELVP